MAALAVEMRALDRLRVKAERKVRLTRLALVVVWLADTSERKRVWSRGHFGHARRGCRGMVSSLALTLIRGFQKFTDAQRASGIPNA